MLGRPPKLWHLTALVLASALVLGLFRAVGTALFFGLGLLVACLVASRAILRANRAVVRLGRRWIERADDGAAGQARFAVGLLLMAASLLLTVTSVVTLIAAAFIAFAVSCLKSYGP